MIDTQDDKDLSKKLLLMSNKVVTDLSSDDPLVQQKMINQCSSASGREELCGSFEIPTAPGTVGYRIAHYDTLTDVGVTGVARLIINETEDSLGGDESPMDLFVGGALPNWSITSLFSFLAELVADPALQSQFLTADSSTRTQILANYQLTDTYGEIGAMLAYEQGQTHPALAGSVEKIMQTMYGTYQFA
jgi:hypothetical protein